MRLIDLSHVIEDGMTTYRGLPGPVISDHLSYDASRDLYEAGTEFQIGRIEMVANTGTYLDTPAHRWRGADDLSDVSVERVAELPGVCVDATGVGEAIGPELFAGLEVRGCAVLVRTDWSRHWRTEAYLSGHPYLTEDAAVWLRDQGAALVGIDSHNIDDTRGRIRPVHSVLLKAGVLIVEHLTNLASLPADGFVFTAAPPKVKGMGTWPVRAMARVG